MASMKTATLALSFVVATLLGPDASGWQGAQGPRGRVVETASGRPLEGLVVRVQFAGKTLAETTTGVDGSFQFAPLERPRRVVEVVTDAWRVTPRKVKLDEEQRAGRRALEFEAERIHASRLRSRLVDQKTGEPVPDFVVRVRGESVTTNAKGGFETARSFEEGKLELLLIDHPRFGSAPWRSVSLGEPASIEHEHRVVSTGEPEPPQLMEFRIDVGPTYPLEVVLPEGTQADDFHASFPGPSLTRDLHRLVSGDPGSPMSLFYGGAATPGGLEPRAPLRAGASPWARFRAPIAVGEDPGPNPLRLRSADGHWSGESRVNSWEGVYPALVPITLEARGAIMGVVVDPAGGPVPTAWIRLTNSVDLGDLGDLGDVARELGTDREGHFALKWLPAGRYSMRVQTERYEVWTSEVIVEPLATESLEVLLTSSVSLGNVSGVLRSRTGQHRPAAGKPMAAGVLALQSLEDPSFFLLKTPSYRKSDGEYKASFVFEQVPAGAYTLSLRPMDNLPWNTLRMQISVPAEGIEFICADDQPTFDLEFRSFDAASGDAIEGTSSLVWLGDPLDERRLDDDWETKRYEGLPEGTPIHWIAWAAGHQLARGDETAFRGQGDARVVEARLVPGWGQVFKVTTRAGDPLPDVVLVVDGEPVGRTDAAGLVSASRSTKPAQLEFRLEGWHVSWGTIDPADAQFSYDVETPVYLSRDE